MKPYKPREYSFEDAAHLARRAGFGATSIEIEQLRRLGPEVAVEKLLSFSSNDGTEPNPHDFMVFAENGQIANGGPLGKALLTLQGWWLHKMLFTQQPLKEKLTLFWHGHFATGLDKVRSPFMLRNQNELFRRQGLGHFEALVLEVTKDPAMLVYLDNFRNEKKHPNENYARELMELFTMGVHGGYGEKDVQEAARALTGWGLDRKNPRGDPKFQFRPQAHDTGQKTVLGQTGNLEGTDVVRVTANHPSTARFITAKLWRYFVSETLPDEIGAELAQHWTRSQGNTRELLREVFTSEAFYAPENRSSLIKTPLEYVVGALRSSGAKLSPEHELGLVQQLATMAQIPLYPPSVKGWDGGLDWIADGTVLARMVFIGALSSGRLPARDPKAENQRGQGKPQEVRGLDWPLGKDLNETMDLIGRQFLGANLEGSLRKALETYAKGRNTREVARGLAYLVLVSPQYHLA